MFSPAVGVFFGEIDWIGQKSGGTRCRWMVLKDEKTIFDDILTLEAIITAEWAPEEDDEGGPDKWDKNNLRGDYKE